MIDRCEKLKGESNRRIQDTLSECESILSYFFYVLPSKSINTMKKYLKYSPFM